MGILFRITVSVVHAVKDRISPRVQIGRTLRNESHHIKEAFPEFGNVEHLVCRVAVQKERLTKQGKKPVTQQKNQDRVQDSPLNLDVRAMDLRVRVEARMHYHCMNA